MHDLIARLPPGAKVLDLGAASGSFRTDRKDLCLVRLDLEVPQNRKSGLHVSADAACLPFEPHVFDLIISNHSLEHFCNLHKAVQEIGRVAKENGALYIAVPDATTLTDRVYRWLARGGGHVNPFRAPGDIITLVETLTPLKHRATQVLFSSLSFLNAHNFVAPPPRRIALFAFGSECFLVIFNWTLRLLDRLLGTRLSQYGWSFYFGNVTRAESSERWVNVCVRCGSGHPERFLRTSRAVRRIMKVLDVYRCPVCGATNILTPD